MREIMQGEPDIDAAAARTIAAAMREVARADGPHPKEDALIAAFSADLPEGADTVDLGTIQSPAQREALLKSLVLVAFADGKVSDPERAVIQRYASALGVDAPALSAVFVDVASSLLSRFAGVRIWKEEVAGIGRQMGLSDAVIEEALKASAAEVG